MSKRIYWQSIDFEICGYVNSEEDFELIKEVCEIEGPVPEQTYRLRVLEGYGIVLPKGERDVS